jgi:hypothetical protein
LRFINVFSNEQRGDQVIYGYASFSDESTQ